MTDLLTGRTAIIYGGGGGIGAGVAQTFAREGARVFLAGRTLGTLEAVADVADVAAFFASDRAAGITGSMTNLTSGLVLR